MFLFLFYFATYNSQCEVDAAEAASKYTHKQQILHTHRIQTQFEIIKSSPRYTNFTHTPIQY